MSSNSHLTQSQNEQENQGDPTKYKAQLYSSSLSNRLQKLNQAESSVKNPPVSMPA